MIKLRKMKEMRIKKLTECKLMNYFNLSLSSLTYVKSIIFIEALLHNIANIIIMLYTDFILSIKFI